EAHVADHDARELHRLELCDGCQGSGLPDVDVDDLDHGRRLTRAELERDGPAGMVRGRTEPALVLQRVDLHDDPIGVVAKVVALLLESRAVRDHGVQTLGALGAWVRAEAGGAQGAGRLPVRGQTEAVGIADVVEIGVEWPSW